MNERGATSEARYEPVIGLEIHVQLRTRTKMFCGCELSFGDRPNVHTCPICLAHPGSLPTTNERAVLYALEIALALDCEIAPRSIFARKNYFYPDNPKAYQISQYDTPLATAGRLGEVRIHRVHLEEDAAKLVHVSESGRIHGSGESLVDFNRAGTPLVEIVSEPDLRDPAAAREWLQLLRTTIRQIGASDVNMEEGSLRCDANVSLRPAGSSGLGTKTELKNMNSFRFIERGIAAEIERQRAILDAGQEVVQETLHFDPRGGSLTSLRSKEEAHDYRYFPEPDLVPLAPTEAMLARARESLPELPAERRERYAAELGLAAAQATQLAFDAELGDYFERVVESAPDVDAPVIANWVAGDLVAALRDADQDGDSPASSRVEPPALGKLAAMAQRGEVSSGAARSVLAAMVAEGGDPRAIVEREGLGQIDDSGELEAIVGRAIEAEAEAAERVRGGNPKAIGPLVGFVMRETKGRAEGAEVTRLIRERLGA
ncbi:MAG: Asp-tRNA(Asn)/Glu-tRNA(Gln) amidotransferase subunit GatB [Solirubrobacterales bacterium]|nr:Asp-tRNA(Asn)/Glu-tRNA(Gln) amidotransferase subunit GatB [Solirubrobacterales bacterium]